MFSLQEKCVELNTDGVKENVNLVEQSETSVANSSSNVEDTNRKTRYFIFHCFLFDIKIHTLVLEKHMHLTHFVPFCIQTIAHIAVIRICYYKSIIWIFSLS